MIKIGKYYYKNLWAFIQVIVFKKPNAYVKGFKAKPIEWTCHVCNKIRPDHKISVRTTSQIYKGIEITQNVRYCNDDSLCVEKSKEITFFQRKDSQN